MTAEVTATGTRCTFCEVQRNAVGGSSPLRGEREPLVRRQTSYRGARQDNETYSLLTRQELAEASHSTRVSGKHPQAPGVERGYPFRNINAPRDQTFED